jgi:hypothetical protein
MAENIIIPEQIYLGFRQDPDAKLGFGTYYENNAACRKRQSTVDGWVKAGNEQSNYHKKHYQKVEGVEHVDNELVPATLEGNIPQSGFKLSKKVTHGGGWNDLTVYWRVVDPRGFELEISSGNLAKLFQYCDISKGDISGECVWGWDKANGSKVVLLPVNSEIYISSQKSTDIHNASTLPTRWIPLGNEVALKNGITGIFLGEMYIVVANTEGRCEATKTYVIKTTSKELTGMHYYVKSPKIISATPTEKSYTQEEAIAFVNSEIEAGVKDYAASNTGLHGKTIYASSNPKILDDIKLKYLALSKEEGLQLIRSLTNAPPPDFKFDHYGKVSLRQYQISQLDSISYHLGFSLLGGYHNMSAHLIKGIDNMNSRSSYLQYNRDAHEYSINEESEQAKFANGVSDSLMIKVHQMSFLNESVKNGLQFARLENKNERYPVYGHNSELKNLNGFDFYYKVIIVIENTKEVIFGSI